LGVCWGGRRHMSDNTRTNEDAELVTTSRTAVDGVSAASIAKRGTGVYAAFYKVAIRR
jgi:hypothetical protein